MSQKKKDVKKKFFALRIVTEETEEVDVEEVAQNILDNLEDGLSETVNDYLEDMGIDVEDANEDDLESLTDAIKIKLKELILKW